MTSEDSLTEIEAVVAESNYITEDSESLKADLAKDAESSPEVAETKETKEATKEHSEKPKRPGRLERENTRQAQRIAELEARFEQSIESQPYKSDKPDVNAPPEMSQYPDAVEYFEAHNKWIVNQAFKQRDKDAEDARVLQEQSRQAGEYLGKVLALAESNPDFESNLDDMIYDGVLNKTVMDAIISSPIGDKVSLYLTKYPEEAALFSQMSDVQIYRAIGFLENGLQNIDFSDGNKAVRATKAPQPITPVKTNATSSKDPGDEDYDESRVKRIARRKALGLPY